MSDQTTDGAAIGRDTPLPTRINIGCGYDIRPGYLNVDSGDWHKPDLIADVTELQSLPAGHFEEALAQDVLEHIPRPKQVSTMQGWARLLRQGGALHVRVPSITDMFTLLKTDAFRTDVERHHHWVHMLFGTQAYPGDFHLCGYTYLTILDVGRQAGLFLSGLEIKDEWLFVATYRKVDSVELLNDREWVTHHYVLFQQYAPDPEGLAFWVNSLATGAHTRAEVALALRHA